jgi:hypothetical protein
MGRGRHVAPSNVLGPPSFSVPGLFYAMEIHDLDAGACRRLIASALYHAVRDVRRGRPCGQHCRRTGVHVCASDARAWLATDGATWADALDLDGDVLRAFLARVGRTLPNVTN